MVYRSISVKPQSIGNNCLVVLNPVHKGLVWVEILVWLSLFFSLLVSSSLWPWYFAVRFCSKKTEPLQDRFVFSDVPRSRNAACVSFLFWPLSDDDMMDVGLLFIFLYYDFSVKDSPPLTQHVQEQLRKHWKTNKICYIKKNHVWFIRTRLLVLVCRWDLTWDVRQHDDDEKVVIVEGDVVFVGESHRVHARPPDVR